jgi:serine/threonine-protein kinase
MGLNHGNIAQVLELGESDGRYFLAMELVDGWSLSEVIKRARNADLALPLELSLYVVVEVCRALSYAHNQTVKGQPMGIVHRDVSPQNVLISDQGEVKLTDFGIAKARTKTEQTGIGVVKGKIAYMSPEQASGAELDHRSDLYSLGIVLYSMVTGKLPFEGGAPVEVMVRIQAGDFTPPDKVKPKLNKELTQLIMKAMAPRPADRFQTAEAMLLAAEKVLRHQFPPTGRTELKAFLDELHGRDGVPPISRAPTAPTPADVELSKDPVEVGSSMMLTTPEPVQRPPPRWSGEVPRRSGERPRPRGGGAQRKVLLVVAGVGVLLFLFVMLHPDPASTTAPAPAPAPPPPAQAQVTPPPQPQPPPPQAPQAEAAPAPAPEPEPEAAAPDAGAAVAVSEDQDQDEDEDKLMSEAVANATNVVIGEEDEVAEASPIEEGTPLPQPEPQAAAPAAPAPAPPVPPAPPRPAPSKPATTTTDRRDPPKPAAPAPPRADSTVSVLVTSQPAGAVVKLKKRVFGKTPIPLRFKTGLIFELTFVKNGFAPTNKRFLVTTRKDQKVVAVLASHPAPRKRR